MNPTLKLLILLTACGSMTSTEIWARGWKPNLGSVGTDLHDAARQGQGAINGAYQRVEDAAYPTVRPYADAYDPSGRVGAGMDASRVLRRVTAQHTSIQTCVVENPLSVPIHYSFLTGGRSWTSVTLPAKHQTEIRGYTPLEIRFDNARGRTIQYHLTIGARHRFSVSPQGLDLVR